VMWLGIWPLTQEGRNDEEQNRWRHPMMILLLTTLATAQDVLDPKRLECEAADGEYFC